MVIILGEFFFLLDAQLVSKRAEPLIVAGPPGSTRRLEQTMEVLFPRASAIPRRFDLQIVEMVPGQPYELNGLRVMPTQVDHACGDPALALRIDVAGKVIAYSGDTGWTDALLPVVHGAGLFVSECYTYGRVVKYHIDYQSLLDHREALGAKRLVVTHLGPEALANRATMAFEAAYDGMTIDL
jgi:ribonuclease BN (tRNA processing enzyme)